ncbi:MULTISPECIES: glycosyltransferase family 2 protein [unclassified Coleofasciculus]|uniref:glycosyltransferase family 2 protein n=1 Tax=unclassified Coleofasciculus TaxID=2692782 RepID=UPI001881AE59|nr:MULTISPECIES: glycosyltransferase family A protein [unclassified Coleofasciculus]MBE9125524.1 glycosyltransferase family 2 protein [Coleofasciculus sp. LEGE 07081]MBE9148612.1 glycosyltransferase family 2 protein [Coleofasciculus sp. LEGE 07092]
MNSPLVSVIIPVNNGEPYLANAIESVLSQTYSLYEIIIVDDRSTDNTELIAKSYPQVRYIRAKGQGSAAAYNSGIEAAKGELIAFLDHDDFWTTDKLTVQVNYLISHPDIQYTIAKMKSFLEPGCEMPAGFRKELLEKAAVAPIPGTLVVRKPLFEVIGTFNHDLTTAEDVDWFARAKDAGIPMAVVAQVLLCKRIHTSNLSLNSTNNNQNLLKVLRQSIKRQRTQTTTK